MGDQADRHRDAQVITTVMACADSAGVIARCRPPRRRSDMTMVFLRGPKVAVLALPLRIFDTLEEYDVEIIRSGSQGDRYRLVLAVTEALAAQSTRVPERRAKLRRRLEREGGVVDE
jgi:hypothetical protein